ncbi:Uncharacterised protein [Mycobacteroides abscessus subsp. massiliense]|nr:Uncharacterised protein [Mycobacteroides abscessus subsp. massiliense]
MQLDDLYRFEESGRLLSELHGQHRADREVGGNQHTRSGAVRQPGAHLVQPLVGEAGGADDGMDAVTDQELQVVHDDIGMGEVDDHTGRGERLQ